MPLSSAAPRRLSLALAALLASCGGETGPGAPPEAEALQRVHPAHAAEVLDGGEPLVAVEEGFARASRSGGWTVAGSLSAVLPRRAGEAIRFSRPGFEARVRERGLTGEGVPAGGAVAYAREGGTSFWRSSGAGFEEWLSIGAGSARAGRAVAVWDVEGATLRADGGAIELCGEGGGARIRVTAPRAFTAGGRVIHASLAIAGSSIELTADAGGEAALIDPLWTSIASLGTARRRHTAVRSGSSVIFIGGEDGAPLASSEAYDVANDSWSALPPLATARFDHVAAIVNAGGGLNQLLVAGGDGGSGPVASAEIRALNGGPWGPASPMTVPRSGAAVVVVGVGALVLGGSNGAPLASVELYNASLGSWSTRAPMTTARAHPAVGWLNTGKLLVAGGDGASGPLASAEVYDFNANTWTPVASMTTARSGHQATLLLGGEELVTGGTNGGPLASAEIYNPTLDVWKLAAPMSAARSGHAAVLIETLNSQDTHAPDYYKTLGLGTQVQTGKVLVTGGAGLSSVEIYDPVADAWTPAPPMSTPRAEHTATALWNGQILAAGGTSGGAALASAEIYDALAALGTPCGSSSQCQSGICASGFCCNGVVDFPCATCAAAGGATADGIWTPLFGASSCGWYGDGCWQGGTSCQAGKCVGAKQNNCTAGSTSCFMSVGCTSRFGCTIYAAPNGSVCSGCNLGKVCFAGGWVQGPSLSPLGAACTQDGDCQSSHCAGGICRPACGPGPCDTWSPAASFTQKSRSGSAGAALLGGKVLLAGGVDQLTVPPFGPTLSTYLRYSDLFDPASNTSSPVSGLWDERAGHTLTVLLDGRLLAAGGDQILGSSPTPITLSSSEVYDPAAGGWVPAAPMSAARSHHTATRLASGKLLVAGGDTMSSGALSSADVYDPATNTWTAAPPMSIARTGHAAALLPGGQVLVCGPGQTAELYDPATGAWTAAAPMLQARSGHTATPLPNGEVLVAGGAGQTAEIYDPTSNSWSPTSPMLAARSGHTATLLPNGKVLVAAGSSSAVAELYDPATNLWSPAGPMLVPTRSGATAALLPGGRVLVAFGADSETLPWATLDAEIYDPGNGAADGAPCGSAAQCQSGFCADGVCCNTACSNGPCDACSVAAGGAVDGVCAGFSGTACDDGNACTQIDTCQSGACVGQSPIACAPVDACHVAGTCDPPSGLCAPGAPVVCAPLDFCHVAGVCNLQSGLCSNPTKADGTVCNDGNGCTSGDTCQSGVCTPGGPKLCTPIDACHGPGTCFPPSGACNVGANVVCQPLDACHVAGLCVTMTGLCTNPTKPDGSPCGGGSLCMAGICISQADAGADGGSGAGGGDAGPDDAGLDGGAGGGGQDASADAGNDASFDAGNDAGSDAGSDAGFVGGAGGSGGSSSFDAGSDAGTGGGAGGSGGSSSFDAGTDAGFGGAGGSGGSSGNAAGTGGGFGGAGGAVAASSGSSSGSTGAGGAAGADAKPAGTGTGTQCGCVAAGAPSSVTGTWSWIALAALLLRRRRSGGRA